MICFSFVTFELVMALLLKLLLIIYIKASLFEHQFIPLFVELLHNRLIVLHLQLLTLFDLLRIQP